MSLRDDILKDLLPTKWSQWIASLTIISGIASFFLPHPLKLLGIGLSPCTELLLRISLPLSLWLLGSLIVLAILVRHCKAINPPKRTAPPPLPLLGKSGKLPKEQTDILLILFKQELLTFQVAQHLNMEKKEDIVKYHLQALAKKGFVREITLPIKGLPGQTSWHIIDKGKAYLIENKLIS